MSIFVDTSKFLEEFYDDISFQHYTDYSQMGFTHVHSQFEVFFCSDNVLQSSIINGEEYRYKYPCVIISSPYTIHASSCIEPHKTRFERFVINFKESVLEQFDKSLIPEGIICKNSGLMFRLSEEQADRLKSLIASFSADSETELKLLLVTFINRLAEYSPVPQAICVGSPSFYIQEVLQYMAEHYAEDISSDSVAKQFSISRSKLDRDFKRFIGITVHSYIDMCRLNQSKIYLTRRGDLSIGEISALSGFSSETYFFQFFKKHIGVTPLEYRRRIMPSN